MPITTPTPPAPPPAPGMTMASSAAAWTATDLATDPHQRSDKPERVRRMFSAIAGSYDLNNRLHSLGLDQSWRRFAVRASRIQATDVCLDVACGTGDLTEAIARAGALRVTGLDFTPEMLTIARARAERLSTGGFAGRINYIQGDAQRLPFPDASVDVVSMAFGLRNVLDPAQVLREFRRVLRPGGRATILEFAEPTFPPARWINAVYCRHIMPLTATWISGDKSGAYKYLPKSVSTFWTPAQLRAALHTAGFAAASSTSLTMGLCVSTTALVDGAL